jgi:hypothetical protein
MARMDAQVEATLAAEREADERHATARRVREELEIRRVLGEATEAQLQEAARAEEEAETEARAAAGATATAERARERLREQLRPVEVEVAREVAEALRARARELAPKLIAAWEAVSALNEEYREVWQLIDDQFGHQSRLRRAARLPPHAGVWNLCWPELFYHPWSPNGGKYGHWRKVAEEVASA